MDEKMHFMTEPEELLNWMKEHEEFKVMNKEDAQILLNYIEGHDYRLGTDKDGSLVRVDINTDEYEAEPYSLDDVIDIVCEWNDELIRYTSQELNELSQGQDKSSLEVKLASLKQDEIRLDKMFEQTKYPAEIEALAVQLADAFIERLGLSPITMLVMMESIQQRIVENGKRGKATWLYIDEFHVLLNSEYSAKYLQQLWKKVRKQGGLCTGITQNVVDLLQNYTATTMLANSEFVALLKQANTDSSKMAEVIGVSDAQLRFVTNSQSGMGLLKCGNVVIPFDNQIGKDTSLYKLYNTNIHEMIAEQKEKEKSTE